ncbi:MAG: peptide chain release factor 1 [Acidobacteriota bacterium]|jgi:peptide chain release factor 1
MDAQLIEKLEHLVERHREIAGQLSDPGIISDQERFRELSMAYADLGETVKAFNEYKKALADYEGALELSQGDDPELAEMGREEAESLEPELQELERSLMVMLLPKDPLDARNVILEIRAGTGGDEAGLFASDLFRMYTRYAEAKHWKMEVMESSPTELGGLKEVIASISGDRVYSRLKFEGGVHRVQRVPATEGSGRIHTSAVTVVVMPEADEIDVQIDEKDLRIDRFCSSGPGGQSVNTTYSAVRITHIPTGVVVSCQDEKSQIKNKAKALKILRSRLLKMEEDKRMAELSLTRKSMVGSGDRSEKIRTYNFPQSRVTDHRINLSLHRLQDVLDGSMDMLLDPLIQTFEAQRLEEEFSKVAARD